MIALLLDVLLTRYISPSSLIASGAWDIARLNGVFLSEWICMLEVGYFKAG
jgi:hypothetical protein